MTTLFEADQARRARIQREHDARVRPAPRGKPPLLIRVILGGQGGGVELLQRVSYGAVPLGTYACFPIHDGSDLLKPAPPPTYPGPSKAEADERDEAAQGYRTASFCPTAVCRGKVRTERGIHHRWDRATGRCLFCRKTKEQTRLAPPITLEQALKGH